MKFYGLKYHKVRDINGSIVTIQDVLNGYHSEKYFHIVHDVEMIFVRGNRGKTFRGRTPHFRIKNARGGKESELHRFGKEHFKKMFDSNSELIIGYWVKSRCVQSDVCKSENNYNGCKCTNSQLRKTDLKELYDTCIVEGEYNGYRGDLMLTNSNHPERVPMFIEIAYKHECEKEKIESGIPIIEIKIQHPEDVERKIEEENVIIDYDNKSFPYSGNRPEMLRFYNFIRIVESPNEMKRFLFYNTGKDRNFVLFAADLVTSKNVNTEHDGNAAFECAICPNSIVVERIAMKENKTIEDVMYSIGLTSAVNHGIHVRECQICKHFQRGNICRLRVGYTKPSPFTGTIYTISSSITDKATKIKNTIDEALKCQYFELNQIQCSVISSKCVDIQKWEWVPHS